MRIEVYAVCVEAFDAAKELCGAAITRRATRELANVPAKRPCCECHHARALDNARVARHKRVHSDDLDGPASLPYPSALASRRPRCFADAAMATAMDEAPTRSSRGCAATELAAVNLSRRYEAQLLSQNKLGHRTG